MLLDRSSRDLIHMYLGWTQDLTYLEPDLEKDFSDALYVRRLQAIEDLLEQDLESVEAIKVGTLEVSYKRKFKALYLEGYRLIEELANMIVPFKKAYLNKYANYIDQSPQHYLDVR
jgi:hypothetical protein